ncbi:MAG TPA: sulfurtransferase [Candidatus Acidoferrales bacterium]|nr:sulfurtransferase [Candidatus Acidoferrales bacterium]
MGDYKHPEMLVSTNWVAEHGHDANVRLVEVDVDTSAYDQGHVAGAVGWNWQTQLQDGVRRDILDKSQFEELMGRSGITPETTVILYGDNNNWFAAYALWQMKYFRHGDARLMNGGRKKWLLEGRPTATDAPRIAPSSYRAPAPDPSVRAFRDDVFAVIDGRSRAHLVDVRSGDEFTGKVIAPPGMSETAQRGGHIPTAINVPWSQAAGEDGTFKSYDELVQLYQGKGVHGADAIAYCRIGERSSHTWFALKYLLGLQNVRNYDGSWTEWGNLVGAPIEKGVAASAS